MCRRGAPFSDAVLGRSVSGGVVPIRGVKDAAVLSLADRDAVDVWNGDAGILSSRCTLSLSGESSVRNENVLR